MTIWDDCRGCVSCGASEATTRFDWYEGESEPLCATCQFRLDNAGLMREAAANQVWADNMAPLFNKDGR
jgi:hypothetical protein